MYQKSLYSKKTKKLPIYKFRKIRTLSIEIHSQESFHRKKFIILPLKKFFHYFP